jgi:hypothetical protein
MRRLAPVGMTNFLNRIERKFSKGSNARGFEMDIQGQARKAEQLRELHHGGRILILANAWDVASARVFEEMGFPAIATTSAGIAASLGYADGADCAGGACACDSGFGSGIWADS